MDKPADLQERARRSEELLARRRYAVRGKPERSFLNISDLSREDVARIIEGGIDIKNNPAKYNETLKGLSVGLLFQKTSTRTRVSFEIGVGEMGGQPLYVDWRTSNFTLSDLSDEIKVFSRFVDLIMARVYKHDDLVEMRRHSEVPVINGLSDLSHPCQGLTDYMTMQEHFGRLEGLTLAYVGDGNNVCNSLIEGGAKTGVRVAVAHPEGYAPNQAIVDAARAEGGVVELFTRPEDAVAGADVVYTDTWISMGEEDQREHKLKAFGGFCVDEQMLSHAEPHALVMHCLPAHRGYEISDGALDALHSVVYDQAENRKHLQKYLMGWIMERV
ncbi:MAG TPA: ornithine carbamoyltransferase [Longimicrobium sp.]|nr:ornithine carbamoyltransferase [Longimicrobium sp.]